MSDADVWGQFLHDQGVVVLSGLLAVLAVLSVTVSWFIHRAWRASQ